MVYIYLIETDRGKLYNNILFTMKRYPAEGWQIRRKNKDWGIKKDSLLRGSFMMPFEWYKIIDEETMGKIREIDEQIIKLKEKKILLVKENFWKFDTLTLEKFEELQKELGVV